MVAIDPCTGDEVEHCVAQELKALIVPNPILRMLVDVGRMSKRATQETRVAELVPQRLLQCLKDVRLTLGAI